MRRYSKKIFSLMICLAFFLIMLTGCIPKKTEPVKIPCPLPQGNLVDKAFETAKSTLGQPDCRYQFDAVFSSLRSICEGDSGMQNKTFFSDFLMWAKNEGIISSLQAKEYYTRYFSHFFVSLPDNYRTCGYCRQLKQIISDCKEELKQKEQGLLKICSDKSSFAKASSDFQEVELILEATCSACAAE